MSRATLSSLALLSPLPDLFLKEDGSRVASRAEWDAHRSRLYRLAIDMQYGGMPPAPEFLEVEPLYVCDVTCSYRIHTGRRERPITFIMQVVLPAKKADKYPIIVDGDGCFAYVYRDEHLQMMSDFGAAFVRFNRTELAHDIKEDVHTDGLYAVYPDAGFSALAAWAWGYHRCVDAVLKLGIADPSLIAFTGHSRGGKTALIAGATDPRAVIVNPNGSGAGGAGCYRVHSKTLCEDGAVRRSERLSDLLKNFPFWFGREMPPYAEKEGELPFDEHMLKALVAPRILLDTEALSDAWANPAGTYLTHLATLEAYRFLGAEENCLIHYRNGFHKHVPEDYRILLNVMEHVRSGASLDPMIGQPPFEGLTPVHEWRAPAAD